MIKLKLIGKKDKNNKEIFIGDFVKYKLYEYEKEQIAEVCWDDNICACTLKRDTFVVDSRGNIEMLFIYSHEMLEIINKGD